jgi:hypothetical protein
MRADCLENVEASTFHKHMRLQGLIYGWLYLFTTGNMFTMQEKFELHLLSCNRISGSSQMTVPLRIRSHKRMSKYTRFWAFTAVIMKTSAFWDPTPCGSCKNRLFEGTQLLLSASAVPSLLMLFTLMKGAIHPSEKPVLTRATRRHIPEYGNLQC